MGPKPSRNDGEWKRVGFSRRQWPTAEPGAMQGGPGNGCQPGLHSRQLRGGRKRWRAGHGAIFADELMQFTNGQIQRPVGVGLTRVVRRCVAVGLREHQSHRQEQANGCTRRLYR